MTLRVTSFAVILPLIFASAAALASVDPAEGFIASARTYLQQNDLRGAEIQLRNALKTSPKNATARVMLAQLYLDGGAPNTAEAELLIAEQAHVPDATIAPLRARALYEEGRVGDLLKLVPDGNRTAKAESVVRTYRGSAELIVGDTTRAQAEFSSAHNLDMRAPGPLVGMARIDLIKHQPQAAETLVDAALKLSPHDSDVLDMKGTLRLLRGDTPGALTAFDAALASNPHNFHALLDRAAAYVSDNRLDKANGDIQTILGVSPDSGSANYLDALVDARRGRLQDADNALEKLRPVMDQIPDAYFLAAIVKYNLNQLEQAEALMRRFVAQRPGNPQAYELLGSIALRRGDAAQAVDLLQKAVKLAPSDPNALGLLAEAETANGNASMAMALLAQAIKDHPDDTRLRTQQAVGDLALGNGGQSLAELTEIYRSGKGNPLAGPPLVLAALRAGRLDIASPMAEHLVQQNPNDLFDQQLLGAVRMAQKNLPAAENIFRGILAKSPNMIAARTSLAKIYLLTQRPDAARKLFKDRLAADPSDLASAQALAAIYVDAKDDKDAVAVLQATQNVLTTDPAPSLAIVALYAQQKKWSDAIKLSNLVVAQFPASKQIYENLAAVYIASGDMKNGIATYKHAVDSYPASADLWERYSLALTLAKNYPGALDAISKALALDPANVNYKGEAISLTDQVKGPDAALGMVDAMAHGGEDSAAILVASDVLERQGKRDAAIPLFQKVMASHPTLVILLRLCGLYQQAGTLEPAIDAANAWISKHPDDFAARLMLAELYGANRKYDLAQANFEKLNAERPSDPVILNNLAWFYSRKNDPRALALAQKAYDLAPGVASISDTLGWILTKMNRASEGINYLKSANAANPDDPSSAFHYATALDQTGKAAHARAILEKLLQTTEPFDERADAQALLKRLGAAK